ncbi:hypothetical protein N9L18_00355 [Candidatus Pacebacteria bacterium]|nr:hypothetical protein [Candidatus Paceibacterota bacterium]
MKVILSIFALLILTGGGYLFYINNINYETEFNFDKEENEVEVINEKIEEVADDYVSEETENTNMVDTVKVEPIETKKELTPEEKFGKSYHDKQISEYTPIDAGQSLFVSIYSHNYMVTAEIDYDEKSSYEGYCDYLLNDIKNYYNKLLPSYERQTPTISFDELIKNLTCVDSDGHYEVSFSILYSSGYYRDMRVDNNNPIVRL